MTVSKCIAGRFLTKSLCLHILVLKGAEGHPRGAVGPLLKSSQECHGGETGLQRVLAAPRNDPTTSQALLMFGTRQL